MLSRLRHSVCIVTVTNCKLSWVSIKSTQLNTAVAANCQYHAVKRTVYRHCYRLIMQPRQNICIGHRSNQRLQQIDRWAKTDMKHRSPFAQLSWANVIELADNYPFPFLPTHDERILMPIWITWTHAYVVLTVYQCNRILNTAVQVNQTIRTTKINAWPI